MNLKDINLKSLIIGAAITAAIILSEREDLGDLSIGGFNLGELLGAKTEEENSEGSN